MGTILVGLPVPRPTLCPKKFPPLNSCLLDSCLFLFNRWRHSCSIVI